METKKILFLIILYFLVPYKLLAQTNYPQSSLQPLTTDLDFNQNSINNVREVNATTVNTGEVNATTVNTGNVKATTVNSKEVMKIIDASQYPSLQDAIDELKIKGGGTILISGKIKVSNSLLFPRNVDIILKGLGRDRSVIKGENIPTNDYLIKWEAGTKQARLTIKDLYLESFNNNGGIIKYEEDNDKDTDDKLYLTMENVDLYYCGYGEPGITQCGIGIYIKGGRFCHFSNVDIHGGSCGDLCTQTGTALLLENSSHSVFIATRVLAGISGNGFHIKGGGSHTFIGPRIDSGSYYFAYKLENTKNVNFYISQGDNDPTDKHYHIINSKDILLISPYIPGIQGNTTFPIGIHIENSRNVKVYGGLVPDLYSRCGCEYSCPYCYGGKGIVIDSLSKFIEFHNTHIQKYENNVEVGSSNDSYLQLIDGECTCPPLDDAPKSYKFHGTNYEGKTVFKDLGIFNSWVGVGTSWPEHPLHIKESGTYGAGKGLKIENDQGAPSIFLRNNKLPTDTKAWAIVNSTRTLQFYAPPDTEALSPNDIRLIIERYPGTIVTIARTHPWASSAALDISSTTGGLIVPRMNSVEQGNLIPENGMIIYNTDEGKFKVYENGVWKSLLTQ